MRCRVLMCVVAAASVALPARAGFQDQMKAFQTIGYARAAAEACGRIEINPGGMLAVLQKLDAPDQAAVASDEVFTSEAKKNSAKLLSLLGDKACEAALDYETKLGIDIFIEKK